MFVVVSRRPDFRRQCAALLSRWGKVFEIDDVAAAAPGDAGKPPGLVVVDAKFATSVTPAVIQEWLGRCGSARLLLADTSLSPLDELAALAAGAVACCDTGLRREEFERVIDVVLHGGVWVSPAAIPLLMSKLQNFGAPATAAPSPLPDSLEGLTERQREVARLVGRGASNKQIARELDISDRTVKAHLTTIFEKLGVSDRLQLALHVNANRDGARP